MQDPFSFLAVLLLAPLVYANDGTTTFDTILLAHAEPSICPSIDAGVNFKADSDYIVCCYNGLPSATRTTAKGSGGKTVYACCEVDYTCTGAAPVMSDWSVDSNGKRYNTFKRRRSTLTSFRRCPVISNRYTTDSCTGYVNANTSVVPTPAILTNHPILRSHRDGRTASNNLC